MWHARWVCLCGHKGICGQAVQGMLGGACKGCLSVAARTECVDEALLERGQIAYSC